jgi:hypothetical protein
MLTSIVGAISAWREGTSLDEAILDGFRTFITVSISVALGLGIPLLDISGGDFRTIISAGLASGLQVLVKYLDPSNTAYGIQKKEPAPKIDPEDEVQFHI